MSYDLQKIISIIRQRYFISYQGSNYLADMSGHASFTYQAGFEDMVCEWVDVQEILKAIKDKKRKGIFLCKVCGISNSEIISIFNISKQTIYNYCHEVFQLLMGDKGTEEQKMESHKAI